MNRKNSGIEMAYFSIPMETENKGIEMRVFGMSSGETQVK